MPKAFPKEFREDVIRVARSSDSSVVQMTKDFGISESCLHRWLARRRHRARRAAWCHDE